MQSVHIQRGDLQLSIFLFILVSLKQVKVTGLVYSHVMLSLVTYFIQFLKTTTTKTCLLGLEIAFGNMYLLSLNTNWHRHKGKDKNCRNHLTEERRRTGHLSFFHPASYTNTDNHINMHDFLWKPDTQTIDFNAQSTKMVISGRPWEPKMVECINTHKKNSLYSEYTSDNTGAILTQTYVQTFHHVIFVPIALFWYFISMPRYVHHTACSSFIPF